MKFNFEPVSLKFHRETFKLLSCRDVISVNVCITVVDLYGIVFAEETWGKTWFWADNAWSVGNDNLF